MSAPNRHRLHIPGGTGYFEVAQLEAHSSSPSRYFNAAISDPPPPERNCKPGASNQQKLPLTYVTAKTQHTGGFTPRTDGLHDGPGTDTTPPSLHVLEFTEKPMQGYMYKKVTIHV